MKTPLPLVKLFSKIRIESRCLGFSKIFPFILVYFVSFQLIRQHLISSQFLSSSLFHLVSSKLALEDQKERNKLSTTHKIEMTFFLRQCFPFHCLLLSGACILSCYFSYSATSCSVPCLLNVMTLLAPLLSLVCSDLTFMRIALFMS